MELLGKIIEAESNLNVIRFFAFVLLIALLSCQADHNCFVEGAINSGELYDTCKYKNILTNYLQPNKEINISYAIALDNGDITGEPAKFETVTEFYEQVPAHPRFQISPPKFDTTIRQYIIGLKPGCDPNGLEKKHQFS